MTCGSTQSTCSLEADDVVSGVTSCPRLRFVDEVADRACCDVGNVSLKIMSMLRLINLKPPTLRIINSLMLFNQFTI